MEDNNQDLDSGKSSARPEGEIVGREQQTADYDEWLKTTVQEAIDDPRASIPSEEVEKYFAAKREILRKRIATDKL